MKANLLKQQLDNSKFQGEKKAAQKMSGTKIAVVRTKGRAGVRKEIETTLRMLRLYRKNYSAILEKKPETDGMLRKVKDFTICKEVREEDIAKAKLPEGNFYRSSIITILGKTGWAKQR